MNILNLFKSILSLAVAGVFLAGCAADQDIAVAESVAAEQEVTCVDVAGVWQVSDAQVSHTCMAGLQTYNYPVDIVQDGCDVQTVVRGNAIAGKVEGNVIRFDGSYFHPMTGNIQPHDEMVDGDSLSGLMKWNVTSNMDGAVVCHGRTETSATRVSAGKGAGSASAVAEQERGCVDVAGVWQTLDAHVAHTCEGGLQTFNFQAEILQDSCDVKRIYPGNEIKAPVAGKVEGHVIHWQGFPHYTQTVSVMPHDMTLNGDTGSGEVLWRLNDSGGRELCSGRNALNATRQAR